MRVRELLLTNFRVFGEQARFQFSDRVTVIAGVNGKGKTAVLEIGRASCRERVLRIV